MKTGYRKYTWVGNKITEEDMVKLYQLKSKTKKHITDMVAEAVKLYTLRNCNKEKSNSKQ